MGFWDFTSDYRMFIGGRTCTTTDEIISALKQNNITNLDLENSNINDKGAEALSIALPHSNVTNLDLGINNIGDKGVKFLTAALPQTKITNLNNKS